MTLIRVLSSMIEIHIVGTEAVAASPETKPVEACEVSMPGPKNQGPSCRVAEIRTAWPRHAAETCGNHFVNHDLQIVIYSTHLEYFRICYWFKFSWWLWNVYRDCSLFREHDAGLGMDLHYSFQRGHCWTQYKELRFPTWTSSSTLLTGFITHCWQHAAPLSTCSKLQRLRIWCEPLTSAYFRIPFLTIMFAEQNPNKERKSWK